MAEGLRIDLSVYQPGAYAVIRKHTLHGLQRELLRLARERGVDLQALAQGQQGAALDLVDAIDTTTIKYQVLEWNLRDDDGQPLPAPREVTAAHLAFCDAELMRALLDAVNRQRDQGDAAEALPHPTTPSGAS